MEKKQQRKKEIEQKIDEPLLYSSSMILSDQELENEEQVQEQEEFKEEFEEQEELEEEGREKVSWDEIEEKRSRRRN